MRKLFPLLLLLTASPGRGATAYNFIDYTAPATMQYQLTLTQGNSGSGGAPAGDTGSTAGSQSPSGESGSGSVPDGLSGTAQFNVAVYATQSKAQTLPYSLPALPWPESLGKIRGQQAVGEDMPYRDKDNPWTKRTFNISGAQFEFGFIDDNDGGEHESSRIIYQASAPFPADLRYAGVSCGFDDFGFVVSPDLRMWVLADQSKDNGDLSSNYASLYYSKVPTQGHTAFRNTAGKCVAAWARPISHPGIKDGYTCRGTITIGPLKGGGDAKFVAAAPGGGYSRTIRGAYVIDTIMTGEYEYVGDAGYLANMAGLPPCGIPREMPKWVGDPDAATVFPKGSVLFFLSSKEKGLENNLAQIENFIGQASRNPAGSLSIGKPLVRQGERVTVSWETRTVAP